MFVHNNDQTCFDEQLLQKSMKLQRVRQLFLAPVSAAALQFLTLLMCLFNKPLISAEVSN